MTITSIEVPWKTLEKVMESPYKSLAFLAVEPCLDATREVLEEHDKTADQVQFLNEDEEHQEFRWGGVLH